MVSGEPTGPRAPPRNRPSPRSPPPCAPRGRCAQDAGTAGPPSAPPPPSAARRVPRWAGAAATAPGAGGNGAGGHRCQEQTCPVPAPALPLTSIHSDTSSILRLEKVSFRYILSPAAAPARGPRVPALSKEAPRKRAKSQRAPASASCSTRGSGCCGGTSPATSSEPSVDSEPMAGTGGDVSIGLAAAPHLLCQSERGGIGDSRAGVGHGTHHSDTPSQGSCCARCKVLLVGATRLTEVDVDIDQAWGVSVSAWQLLATGDWRDKGHPASAACKHLSPQTCPGLPALSRFRAASLGPLNTHLADG